MRTITVEFSVPEHLYRELEKKAEMMEDVTGRHKTAEDIFREIMKIGCVMECHNKLKALEYELLCRKAAKEAENAQDTV